MIKHFIPNTILAFIYLNVLSPMLLAVYDSVYAVGKL